MSEVGSKEWSKQPIFPGASFKRQDLGPGTIDGSSPQLTKRYKELTTSSQRMEHGEFKSTIAADKARVTGKRVRK